MKLNQIHIITGTIKCLSGLHIGGGDTEMHIGGIDDCVVKHPITQLPYIPGSSLKGKIRSLLEWKTGVVKQEPLEWNESDNGQKTSVLRILQLFGASGSAKLGTAQQTLLGPGRLSFWDCPITEERTRYVRDNNLLYTEAKSENKINRISGTAEDPRQIERVPAETTFEFKLSLKEFDDDDIGDLLKTVLIGLRLLELDNLGGSGSRGYGKIAFKDLYLDPHCGEKKTLSLPIDPFKD